MGLRMGDHKPRSKWAHLDQEKRGHIRDTMSDTGYIRKCRDMCTFHWAVLIASEEDTASGGEERRMNLFEIAHGNQAVLNMPGLTTGLVIKEVELQQHFHMLPGEKP